MSEQPKLYTSLAGWFHLLTAPADYAEEAVFWSRLLVDASEHPVRTVLELGSGGGNNASHMKRDFDLTLVDLSEDMLAISRKLNPECEHAKGDMRTVRLGRTFDAVFVHDAVSYITADDDLRAAIETAAVHCKPGGAGVFAPDFLRETLRLGTDHGGHDGTDGRGMRYLEWVTDPDQSDYLYRVDFAYLLREADGTVRAESESHIEGAFPREMWLRFLDEAGFRATTVPLVLSDVAPGEQDVFVGTRR